MVRKTDLLVPLRPISKHETHLLVSGTAKCPACDTRLSGEDVFDKLPLSDDFNAVTGWMCNECDSIFDLDDKMLYMGKFDLHDQEMTEA